MSSALRSWLCAGLILVVVAGAVQAQNADVAPPQLQPDFFKDQCGDPTRESQFWLLLEGEVSHVVDGRTIQITLADGHVLRVHLAGIALERRMPFSSKAKTFLAETLLHKVVGVSVIPDESWIVGDKRPAEVTAVVPLSEGVLSDAASSLLAQGLVRYKAPPPYTISAYAECQYRRAEAEAHSKELGLWQ